MKTITIEVPNRLEAAIVAFCTALGIRKVQVQADSERKEDDALYLAMQEASLSDTVPVSSFLHHLRNPQPTNNPVRQSE